MTTPVTPSAPWARSYEPSASPPNHTTFVASGHFMTSQEHVAHTLQETLQETPMDADQEEYFADSSRPRAVTFHQPASWSPTEQDDLEGRRSVPPGRGSLSPGRGRPRRGRTESQRRRSSSYSRRRDSSGERRANHPVTPQSPSHRLRKPKSSASLAPLSEGPLGYDYTPLSARSAGFESLSDFGATSPMRRSWFSASNALCDEENPILAQKARGQTRRGCTPLSEEVGHAEDQPLQQKAGVMKKAKNLFRKKKRSA